MNIEHLRAQIDHIDTQLVDLFKDRMQIALEIARYKKENGLPVYDLTRERSLLHKISVRAGDEFEIYMRVFFSTLMDVSRSYQHKYLADATTLSATITRAIEQTPKLFPEKAVVACQGAEGGGAQLATDRLFSVPDIFYFSTFDGVFQAVCNGMCQYGLLPIENSSTGSFKQIYDLFLDFNVYIVRSLSMIDEQGNITRYICISKKLEIYPGADRTSLMMIVPNKSGALYRVLVRFYALGMNLLKHESCPIPGHTADVMFYFDVESPVYAPTLLQLISELENQMEGFRYLGSYLDVK